MSVSEDPIALPLERSIYIGNIFGGIFYGLQIYITFHSVHLTLNSSSNRRTKVFYVVYGILMLLCMSFAMIANSLMGQEMWIEHRNYPGGPVAFWTDNGAVWYNVLGSAADIFGNFMGDALLAIVQLYRLYVIFTERWYIVVFPLLVFLASIAFSIMSVVQSAFPGSSFFEGQDIIYAVPWLSLSCSLNAIITILITARLLMARRRIREIMSEDMSNVYTGVIAILVESALPFTVLGIVFAVLLGKNLPEQLALSLTWGYYIGLAPQLIILRVAMGRAWSKDTSAQVSTSLHFAYNDGAPTESTNGGTVQGMDSDCTENSNMSIEKLGVGSSAV
ncbi:hypothetical protein F5876DRAFT_35388 [Lentinula aff. lateritia]|uniref:Uncharacterized protein n=1 Tax=Lentinula aff. lateritia TaxID=2804960 RepID=A0ACC1U900_9AGAR|nr:hypothetical protein F5876DRAFT_35388 [Lentinula aff. lateritia]